MFQREWLYNMNDIIESLNTNEERIKAIVNGTEWALALGGNYRIIVNYIDDSVAIK